MCLFPYYCFVAIISFAKAKLRSFCISWPEHIIVHTLFIICTMNTSNRQLSRCLEYLIVFSLLLFSDMLDLTTRLCWELVKKEGYIAIWKKPTNNSCYLNREAGTIPPLCDPDDNPDNVWYTCYSTFLLM